MDILELVEQGKVKRIFRARDKISFPGAVCHITQRAAGKESIFLEESDYLYMLYLIKNNTKEFNIEIFSHCLMPNHTHLLIRLSKDNLSGAMKSLYEKYAIYFNKKYSRKGHVFGGAFRQALCFDDTYLLAASLYIHLNPVRAHLIVDPIRYKWSSCSLYAESFKGKTFVNYEFILKILDDNINEARSAYKKLLKNAAMIKTEEFWENSRALDLFKNDISNLFPATLKERFNIKTEFLNDQDLDKEIEKLRKEGRLRSPAKLKARRFLVEQLQARGYSITKIAKKLNTSQRTIYSTLHC